MKKEAYYSDCTLAATAAAFLEEVECWRARHAAQAFRFAEAALLVLDLQLYFADPASHAFVPSLPAIRPGLIRLARAFRQAGRPVITTRHGNTPGGAGLMGRWWKDLLTPGDPGFQLCPEWEELSGIRLDKTQYDAFWQTGLESLLRRRGVRQLVLTGVLTHLCVETTARSAFCRGFEVFLVVDGTATYTRDFHRASLMNLAHGFAVPVLADELRAEMEA